MPLPFLKNKDDGVGVAPVDPIQREPDEGTGLLSAVASDIMNAIKSDNVQLLEDALGAYAEHLKDMDEQQDQGEM